MLKKIIFVFIALNFSVSELCSAKMKPELKKGILIGALAGFAVGVPTGVGVSTLEASCEKPGDSCRSTITRVRMGSWIAGGSILLGTGAGALIGHLVSKKKQVSVLPQLSIDQNSEKYGGLLIQKQF